jgi:hypothetical protein
MRSARRRILGSAALFSGAALIGHILSGVSLRLALTFTAALLILAIFFVARRTRPAERGRLRQLAIAGVIAGIVATAAYDTAKFLLSRSTSAAYNPFEAIRVFGVLLAGSTAPAAVVYASGAAFHLLNGVAFGVAFCLLFRRRTLLAGVAWGLFLELFQLALFPGWLDIRSYAEFAQISVLSHVIYGLVLSAVSNRTLPAE